MLSELTLSTSGGLGTSHPCLVKLKKKALIINELFYKYVTGRSCVSYTIPGPP